MNVEYTARKYELTPNVRREVETGLNKIRKILGDRFETKVILAVEKRRHRAEITINPPKGPIVGLAQTTDMVSAVNEALDHLHKQALKYKTKWLSKKRKAGKKFDGQALDGGSLGERSLTGRSVTRQSLEENIEAAGSLVQATGNALTLPSGLGSRHAAAAAISVAANCISIAVSRVSAESDIRPSTVRSTVWSSPSFAAQAG